MELLLLLLFILIGVMLIKTLEGRFFPKSLNKDFPEDFKCSKKIVSISEKSKIDFTLYMDTDSKTALYCNQLKKKVNIIKSFSLADISKITHFEKSDTDPSDKDHIYVVNLGFTVRLKDGYTFNIYLMNDTAFVRKPLYVYDGNKKILKEYTDFLMNFKKAS